MHHHHKRGRVSVVVCGAVGTVDLLFLWLYGCVVVWLCDVIVWLYGCTVVPV